MYVGMHLTNDHILLTKNGFASITQLFSLVWSAMTDNIILSVSGSIALIVFVYALHFSLLVERESCLCYLRTNIVYVRHQVRHSIRFKLSFFFSLLYL